MIEAESDLLRWIAGHPERHQRTAGDSCSCGWMLPTSQATSRPVSWRSHFDATLIPDLGDVLPSDSRRNGEPEAWRPLVVELYKAIDRRDENCTCSDQWPDAEES